MRWESPRSRREFVCLVAFYTVAEFFARWAGQGNLPGPDPRGWGDPISFDRALRELPALFAITLFCLSIATLLEGIRSSDTPVARPADTLPLTDLRRLGASVSCPVCNEPIAVSETGESFDCPSCHQAMRFASSGHVIRAIAIIAGGWAATFSGMKGLPFLWAWIVAAVVLACWLAPLRRPRLELEMPKEFHRGFPAG